MHHKLSKEKQNSLLGCLSSFHVNAVSLILRSNGAVASFVPPKNFATTILQVLHDFLVKVPNSEVSLPRIETEMMITIALLTEEKV